MGTFFCAVDTNFKVIFNIKSFYFQGKILRDAQENSYHNSNALLKSTGSSRATVSLAIQPAES